MFHYFTVPFSFFHVTLSWAKYFVKIFNCTKQLSFKSTVKTEEMKCVVMTPLSTVFFYNHKTVHLVSAENQTVRHVPTRYSGIKQTRNSYLVVQNSALTYKKNHINFFLNIDDRGFTRLDCLRRFQILKTIKTTTAVQSVPRPGKRYK